MPFQPIILTREGDTLMLPEQPKLHDECLQEVEVYIRLPTDLDALELGMYPFAEMVANDPELIGGTSSYRESTMWGQHEECGGLLWVPKISKSHRAIVCQNCNLRVPIPIEIKTYGELRAHAKNSLLAETR